MQYPIRIERHEYERDTAGAGRWRGAPGVRTRIRFLAENITNAMLAGVRHPTRGFCGAEDGPPNELALIAEGDRTEVTEVVYNRRLPANAAIEFLRGGGGGWGSALDRPEAEVLADIANDYVSVERAAETYGVVADKTHRTLDREATRRRRAERARGNLADTIEQEHTS